jgi:hypothetical protein
MAEWAVTLMSEMGQRGCTRRGVARVGDREVHRQGTEGVSGWDAI